MNRRAQRGERPDVGAPSAAVASSSAPGVAQQREQPVVFIDELAELLGTSTRTIRRQLRARTFFIPEMVRVDKRHRWSRVVVLDVIATSHTWKFDHGRHGKSGLQVVQRKAVGEGARERATR